jgi:hypothetical protein
LNGISHAFLFLLSDGTTKRPLFVHLFNNPDCEAPKCNLQLKSEKKVPVALENISAEITKNSDSEFNSEPIHLNIEWKYCFDIVIIDTPGLSLESTDDEQVRIEAFLHDVIRPVNRLVVHVEEAGQRAWDQTENLRKLIKFFSKQTKKTKQKKTKTKLSFSFLLPPPLWHTGRSIPREEELSTFVPNSALT